MTQEERQFIEIPDEEGNDCNICDLKPLSRQCRWPYCEKNKVIFKIKKQGNSMLTEEMIIKLKELNLL